MGMRLSKIIPIQAVETICDKFDYHPRQFCDVFLLQ